jgi:two-component system, NtrC family, nitrogen regulation sensor histidine kinase NtrY
MKKTTHRFFVHMLLLALAAVLASSVLYLFRNQEIDTRSQISHFRQTFISKDRQAAESLDDFIRMYNEYTASGSHQQDLVRRLINKYEKRDLSFFVFSHDTLQFWTNSTIPLESGDLDEADFGVRRLKNGWYFFRQLREDDQRFVVFSVVKFGYRYQNNFLVNKFQSDYDIPGEFYFLTDRPEEGVPIVNKDDQYAFSINLRRTTGLYEKRTHIIAISAFLAITGLLIFVFFGFRYFSRLFYQKHKTLGIVGFAAYIALLRLITFAGSFPRVIYEDTLFSPALYATSQLLPSLGDLFFNVLFFSIISFFLFTHLRHFDFRGPVYPAGRYVMSFGLFVLIYLFCNLAVFLIKSLVIDSHLNLDVNFIFSLDLFSLAGFLIIGCIFFAFFFLSVVLFRVALNLLQKQSRLWTVFILSLFIFVLWQWVYAGPSPLQWFLYIAAILVFEMERKSDSPQAGFTSLLVSLFLFSLISSFALYQFNREKDLEKRKTLALQLASEQDPVAEFLFLEMEQPLFNDNQLRNLVRNDPYNDAAIYRYLQYHYFYDFWAKYDLQITVCRPDEEMILKPSNVLVNCSQYFENYIGAFGKPTISENLIYLDNNTGRNSYITIIPVSMTETGDDQSIYDQIDPDPPATDPSAYDQIDPDPPATDPLATDPPAYDKTEYYVYIEIDSKYVARDLGFPELLIDERIDINRDLINYSYATYKEGVLISKSGMYNYSIFASTYDQFEGQFAAFDFDGFRHLLYRKDDSSVIIISRPVETFLERIAPFSYLFILFFALVVIFYMLTSRRPLTEIFGLNFKRRVQVSMITIVIVSVLAIGGASALFILNVSSNKNLSFLSEKAHSILVETEMTLDIAGIDEFNERNRSYVTDLLLRQSNVFFTDINLYDNNGELISSSRPRVFEEGLAGTLMDPVAFFTMRNHQLNQFVHTESIGKLEYLSAYILLRNHYQELLGFINLPYFAKQSDLRDEMSYFLVAFINIYLLLLVIAIVVALFISNFVTQPLQLIRESLSKVQLGRINQKINWTRQDEIGGLVMEYNRMIDELAESADLLARSERETAWREMAKQVAHEIKNPLTPMRLNIQYLEKAWKEKTPDWEERLARFTKTMVEQIDNLALIAGAFSDFAKMPEGHNHVLDFRQFLPEALDLFNDTDRASINITMPHADQPLLVRADKSQLIRVMNNLVNNAIQAYPKHAEAQVDILCQREGGDIYVEVKDYGCGIPETLKSNIFSPNFTTKTSGMGLGLSMVKSIIESLGGKVGFFSEEGHGSIFSFRLPLAE